MKTSGNYLETRDERLYSNLTPSRPSRCLKEANSTLTDLVSHYVTY